MSGVVVHSVYKPPKDQFVLPSLGHRDLPHIVIGVVFVISMIRSVFIQFKVSVVEVAEFTKRSHRIPL